jgi:AcrR family transcriptional regulator
MRTPAHEHTTDRDRQLLDVTLEVLAETGYDRLNLEVVAARARASKSTLYRRWPSKADLVVAAFSHAIGHTGHPPDSGSLRDDLLYAVTRIVSEMRRLGDLIAALVPEIRRNPDLGAAFDQQFIQPRYTTVATIFGRAAERGELRAGIDLELVWDLVPGILLYRTLNPGRALTDVIARDLVDQVLLPLTITIRTPDPRHTSQATPSPPA